MAKLEDLAGRRFGRLVATGPHESRKRKTYWPCRCDCGNQVKISATNLKTGNTTSCGCYRREFTAAKNATHSLLAGGKPSEFIVWALMRRRCDDPADDAYPAYGGRGISVCDRWRSFDAFYADMGARPAPDHQIDRIDNDGPYSPENCRWVTRVENCSNRRDNVYVEWRGESLTVYEWARRMGMKPHTIWARLFRLGWNVEQALTTPVRAMRKST